MKKQAALEAIIKARESHELQMAKIEKLISGKSIDDPTSVSKTQCGFGKWLYNEENHMKEILGSQFYEDLDFHHSKWHTEYFRLYNIFFKEERKGLLSKFFGAPKVSDLEMDKAKLYYAELKVTTANLLKAIAASERRLQALNESKFF